jgi:hypothetical protein
VSEPIAARQVTNCGTTKVGVGLLQCRLDLATSGKVMVIGGDSCKGLLLERPRCHNAMERTYTSCIIMVFLYPILTVLVKDDDSQSASHYWPILNNKNAQRPGTM